MAKQKIIRPLGRITDEQEKLLQEMVYDHEMQAHEILGIIYGYLTSHCSEAIERYDDGTIPEFFYTHKDWIKWHG